MKYFLSILLVLSVFPAGVNGLREIKRGDKLPVTGNMEFIKDKGKSVILYLRSDDLKSVTFLRQFLKVIGNTKKIKLFLIDVNSETDKRVKSIFDKIGSEKKIINDPQRKIFGELGVILIPTLIFINDDISLNSYVAGYKSNLNIIFKSHYSALVKGEFPEDVFKVYDKKIAKREFNRIEEQAFTLLIDKNFELSNKMYKKAIEKNGKNLTAKLGFGFTLIMTDRVKEAKEFFLESGKISNSKRVKFGIFLTESILNPDSNNLKSLFKYAGTEPSFFPAVYKAAEILEKNGKVDLSGKIYKHSYKILYRYFCRKK